jgi:hypothetical protein
VPADFTGVGRGPADINPQVAANSPAQDRWLLKEHPKASLKHSIVRGGRQQPTDPPHLLSLLRLRGKRRRYRRRAEKFNELAPLHCRPRGFFGQGHRSGSHEGR